MSQELNDRSDESGILSGNTTDTTHDRMRLMIFGYGISQIVHVAARFSLAEHLADGPLTANEIAQREQLDPGAALRLLRACTAVELTTYDPALGFASTPLLATLRRGVPGSMWGFAVAQIGRAHWLSWGGLTDAIRTGQPQAQATLGCEAWEYYAKAPEEAEAFGESMISINVQSSIEIANFVDTKSARLAVDVGGAGGSLIKAVLERNDALRGVIFDLPHVIAEITPKVVAWGYGDRLTTVAGDFRASVPEADLYFLRFIMHDWDDATCLEILRNCRKSIEPNGRVVIAEILLGENEMSPFEAHIDLTMLTALGGKERTLNGFRELLAAADFKIVATPTTSGLVKIIEAVAT